MAESGLSLTLTDFRSETGEYIGWGSSGWSSDLKAKIDAVCNRAYRRALYPEPLDGDPAWEWHFLSPTDTITTTAGDGDYDLPDDFGSIVGPLTWPSDSQLGCDIPIVGEGRIRSLRGDGVIASGRPQYAAYRVKAGFAGTAGTRYELLLYPTPDAAYVFTYKKNILIAPKLDDTHLVPVGGMPFSELILAGCLAVAELKYFRGQTIKQGDYLSQLRAAIAHDKKRGPEFLGRNGNGGDCSNVDPRLRGTIKFYHNGIEY